MSYIPNQAYLSVGSEITAAKIIEPPEPEPGPGPNTQEK